MSSPTQKSLAHLRKIYPLVKVVERWNQWARIRQDLWGFDILCVGDGETIAVQATSRTNMNARIKKLADNPDVPYLRKAGWKLLVHGWAKRKVKRGGIATRNELVEVDIS